MEDAIRVIIYTPNSWLEKILKDSGMVSLDVLRSMEVDDVRLYIQEVLRGK